MTPLLNSRLRLTAALLLLSAGGIGIRSAQAEVQERNARPPNIVLLLTDDQGVGDLGRNNPVIRTPHIDQLAEESVRFTQFYVHSACAPTRASLMTGRNNQEAGVWGVHGGRDFLHPDEVLLPEVLGNQGYVSAMMGKWHLGKTRDRHPDQRGFTQQHMIVDRLYDDTDPVFMHEGEIFQPEGWSCDILTDLGLNFMQEHRDQPFLLYLAYPQIHAPWYAPEEYIAPYRDDGHSEELATLFGYISHMDANVGRVLEGLKELGLEDNTLVLYIHDNGHINNHERRDLGNGKRLETADTKVRNALMEKGGKGTSWEGGIHVPLYARLPGTFAPRDVETVAHVTDLFPTLLEMSGIDYDSALPLEGRSLLPLLQGNTGTWPDRYVVELKMDPLYDGMNRAQSAGYTSRGYQVLQDKSSIQYEEQDFLAVRNQDFKFVRMEGDTFLFHGGDQVREWNNVIGDFPEVAAEMDAVLKARFEAMVASPRTLTMPTFFIGGINQQILTYAPIELLGDAVNDGKVLTSLRQAGDGARYRIHVTQAGTYRAGVKIFTKWGLRPLEGNGAEIRIRVGEQEVQTPVVAEETLDLGLLTLPEGEAVLTLELASSSASGGPVFAKGIEYITLEREP